MVCGLARRWAISRSVKNACMVAAIAVTGIIAGAGAEPRRGLGEQLRGGWQVPVIPISG